MDRRSNVATSHAGMSGRCWRLTRRSPVQRGSPVLSRQRRENKCRGRAEHGCRAPALRASPSADRQRPLPNSLSTIPGDGILPKGTGIGNRLPAGSHGVVEFVTGRLLQAAGCSRRMASCQLSTAHLATWCQRSRRQSLPVPANSDSPSLRWRLKSPTYLRSDQAWASESGREAFSSRSRSLHSLLNGISSA
jgi:hypothetical protein